MTSKKEIKDSILEIARNHNYTGDSLEVITDIVTHLLYHNQVEIANAVREASLETASLLNSKIKACMDVMYSVYRGKNARVELNFLSNTLISFDKFDPNTVCDGKGFWVYAESEILRKTEKATSSKDNAKSIIGILSTSPIHDIDIVVSEKERYYIDVVFDRTVLYDLSEDIKVTINGIEYPTTRNFYEHMNCSLSVNEKDELDKLFILTIYDYGIRIFKKGYRIERKQDAYKIEEDYYIYVGVGGDKNTDGRWRKVLSRNFDLKKYNVIANLASVDQLPTSGSTGDQEYGYFKPNDKVNIKCFQYTTLKDIDPLAISELIIKGTEMVPFEGYKEDGKTPKVDGDNGRRLIEEIPRESVKSLLYNANYSTRLQSQILSNSDVGALFQEFFIEHIISSTNAYDSASKTLYIYYIPRNIHHLIPDTLFNKFIEQHKSYFITSKIERKPAILCTVTANMLVYQNGSNDIKDQIEAIFAKYNNKLNPIGTLEKKTDEGGYEDKMFYGTNRKYEECIDDEDDDNMIYVGWGGSFVNKDIIEAEIIKIPTVTHIDKEVEFTKYNISGVNTGNRKGQIPPLPTSVVRNNVEIPIYYKFEVEPNFKDNYETISK